ncbi:MAG: hypothetical protein GEV11_10460 [Streptosporangiales bacterium]|nr:hypothetical protein [Streptosporangiales bacterium]
MRLLTARLRAAGRSLALTGAALTGAALTGAALTGAALTGAALTGAVLTGAVLTGAVLTGAALTALVPAASPAYADDLADHLAARLRQDPVYVSDNAVREITPAAAPRLREAAATLGVPAYVVIVPDAREDLLALLRDRLGRDGVYYVGDTDGISAYVRQYGAESALPVRDAEHVALCETDGAADHFVRFTELVHAPGLRERVENLDRDAHESAYEAADRRQDQIMTGAFLGASVVAAIGTFVLAERRRRRRLAAAGVGTLAARRAKVRKSKARREKKRKGGR